jgi:predicted ATPase
VGGPLNGPFPAELAALPWAHPTLDADRAGRLRQHATGDRAGQPHGSFPRRVHFVPLAAVRDPALVPVEIARSIGLQDARGTPLLDHLGGYLARQGVLLILDNVEQVLPAGGFVADLIAVTGRIRILVTSRSPLRLSWEQEFSVAAAVGVNVRC